MTKAECIAEVIKNNGGWANLDTVLNGMLWCVSDYQNNHNWKSAIKRELNRNKMFAKTNFGTSEDYWRVTDYVSSRKRKSEFEKETTENNISTFSEQSKGCANIKNDVIVSEWVNGVDRPNTFSEFGAMASNLVDFYVEHSVAKRETVANLIGGLNVFDFAEMFSTRKGKVVFANNEPTENTFVALPTPTKNVLKRKKTKKKSATKSLPTSVVAYPVIKMFSSQKDGGRGVWKVKWEDNEILLKNPPEKTITWNYINISKDVCKYKCGKIGDVLYKVYINGEAPYYYMFNNPKNKDKLALRNMYWRMFEYGQYKYSDVKLEKVDEVVYEKTREVEFK